MTTEKKREYQRQWYQANKERMKELGKIWAANNPERARAIKQKYAKAHVEEKRIKNAAWMKANPEKNRAAAKRYAKAHPLKVRDAKNAWNRSNPEKARERTAAWNIQNPERRKLSAEQYRKENVGKIRQYQALRRSASDLATPLWANDFYMSEIYELARKRTLVTGMAWQVDHIVPIQSKLVCGLHVECNLGVILGTHNKKKGNRHWPDMP